jgi:hypothetical protein
MMFKPRAFLLGLCFVLASAGLSHAQEWAKKMFDVTSHDFGNVARGAKTEYLFKIHNPFKEEIHISDVRSSCGCTTPRALKDTLATYEESAIVAAFNTKTHLGQRHATLTVVIDKPYHAEVQLQVAGYIRRDIVIHPGEINLGSIDRGTPAEKHISISYAGRADWRVLDVKSPSSYIETQLIEGPRQNGTVSYDLVVRLKGDAPAGALNEQVVLLTNDERSPEVPLDVEGQVVADLTVSPASLLMGVLQPGQKATKQLVIKAKQPFKILGIQCEDPCFQAKIPTTARQMHVLPITFTAGDEQGKVAQRIRVITDMGEDVLAEFSAYAQVVAPVQPTTPTNQPAPEKPLTQVNR